MRLPARGCTTRNPLLSVLTTACGNAHNPAAPAPPTSLLRRCAWVRPSPADSQGVQLCHRTGGATQFIAITVARPP